jgi:hypothetical protein
MKHAFCLSLFVLSSLFSPAQSDLRRATLDSIGAMNAVRKAHQMADLPIVPMNDFQSFPDDKGIYKKGRRYKGVIYSSAKETNTFVGTDVSFHTFMTALHNPRSIIYTDKTDEPPYHGVNCRSYYGTVCSGLITYALGFKITQRSSDILVADYFELIEDQSARGIQLADIVCRDGHPAMVTGIEKDDKGTIIRIEMCSARGSGCCRYYIDGEAAFNKRLKQKNLQIYRYKDLYKNTSYTPINEFVAVDGEVLKSFQYNDVICANRGDKSCYVTEDNVVLNIFKGGEKVEIYKDSKLFRVIDIHDKDTNLTLKDYPYGDYQARVVTGNKKSDYTQWKIVDAKVTIDKDKQRIYFNSANANPVYYEFCSISGGRPTNKDRIYAAEFTDADIKNGYISVMPPNKKTKGKADCTYVKVHFECEYGMVINKLINWYE